MSDGKARWNDRHGCGTAVQRLQAELQQRYEKTARKSPAAVHLIACAAGLIDDSLSPPEPGGSAWATMSRARGDSVAFLGRKRTTACGTFGNRLLRFAETGWDESAKSDETYQDHFNGWTYFLPRLAPYIDQLVAKQ